MIVRRTTLHPSESQIHGKIMTQQVTGTYSNVTGTRRVPAGSSVLVHCKVVVKWQQELADLS